MGVSSTSAGVLRARQDGGGLAEMAATSEGHLEVEIHGPRLPFGAVHAESLRPVFQTDPLYGLVTSQVNAQVGHATGGASSGVNTATAGLFTCATGTTALSFATIQSRKRLKYRPGQGVVGRFTALFPANAASSILVAGMGTAESGFYFGYNGTSFGILHSRAGVREIQTLTITTASTTNENATITLNGVAFSVAVTNSGSTTKTAYEISKGTYTGWQAEQHGATVVFLAGSAGNAAGAFTAAGTSLVGAFAETLAGALSSDTWIPQASWNGDKLDGTGGSGATLDPTKGNVYQIDIQHLGFGSIVFKVEVGHEGNNPSFVTVHAILSPNTRTTPTVTMPSFPFTMTAYSAGSTTNLTVSSGSFAGFIEGQRVFTGPRMTYLRESSGFVGSTAATYYPLFTVRNSLEYGGRANQVVINLLSISAAHDDATPVSFYLIRNATLTGTPAFASFATGSCSDWDTAAATATITTNDQIIFSANTGQSASLFSQFMDDVTLQPGETITLAARAVTGTATYVNASLNTREDQ